MIDGIAALSKSSSYVASARYVFSDLRTGGWIVSAVGAVELLAAFRDPRPGAVGALVRDVAWVMAD